MVKTEWFIAGIILGGGLVHLWEPIIWPPVERAEVAVTAAEPQCVTPHAEPETVETPGIREILEALPLAIRTTEIGVRPQPKPERHGRDEIAQLIGGLK